MHPQTQLGLLSGITSKIQGVVRAPFFPLVGVVEYFLGCGIDRQDDGSRHWDYVSIPRFACDNYGIAIPYSRKNTEKDGRIVGVTWEMDFEEKLLTPALLEVEECYKSKKVTVPVRKTSLKCTETFPHLSWTCHIPSILHRSFEETSWVFYGG